MGIPVLVLAIAVSIAFAVLPVMFAARFVGAGRTTFGWVLLAVVVQGVVSGLLNGLVTNFLVTSPGMAGPLGALITIVAASSAIYAFVLDTTFLKGFLIGVISVVVVVVVLLVAAAVFGVVGHGF